MCLPTGQTPIPAYDQLPAAMRARGASAARATIVVLDDYLGLPQGHPGGSREVLRAAVVDRLSPPPAGFVAFDVDDPSPTDACRRFDAAVAAAGGLDLVVLGLGRNGHVGVNEPGSAADSPTRVVELTARHAGRVRGGTASIQPPSHGVTLGMGAILAAPEVWLLVTGAAKAAVLAEALEGRVTESLPASLLQRHPRLTVIADEPAAAALRRSGGARA